MRFFSAIVMLALLGSSCQRTLPPFKPTIYYEPNEQLVETLPSVFPSLSRLERQSDWGREYQIGQSFAREMDLYRAVTAYKRARILLKIEPASLQQSSRLIEIDYHILLCYYLGGQVQAAVEWFEESRLREVGSTFPAFHDLLILLYDAYMRDGRTTRAEAIRTLIDQLSSEAADQLSLSQMLQEGELKGLEKIECDPDGDQDVKDFLACYKIQAKSTRKAQMLNALLPGAGYHYVGLTRTGWTSFWLNALFGWATYQFFHRGDTAAAIITLGFETGWYFGGIYGAGLAAKQYNERLYEEGAKDLLIRKRLFPALMLQYAF